MQEQRFEIAGDNFAIGRENGNDLIIEDEGISRFHARIVRTGEGYLLVDAGSANGIWVDRNRVNSLKLEHGARFCLGESTFTFEADIRSRPTVSMNGVSSPAAVHPAVRPESAGSMLAPETPQAPLPVVRTTGRRRRPLSLLLLLLLFVGLGFAGIYLLTDGSLTRSGLDVAIQRVLGTPAPG